MRRAAIVVTLAFGALFAAYGALVLLDLLARHEVRTSRALALSAPGALRLETGSSDIEVVGGRGAPRLVTRTVEGLFGATEVRVVQGPDGQVSVRTRCGFPSSVVSCGGSLEVLVPEGTAVEVDAGSGEVGVRGIRGGVTAGTGSGAIQLDDVGGAAVTAETGSGEITGTALRAGRVRADTGSGDVRITAAGAPDAVDVDTGSGDVELIVPDEVYDVGTDTGSGEQRVSVRTDGASARQLRVETGSGDVTVRPGS